MPSPAISHAPATDTLPTQQLRNLATRRYMTHADDAEILERRRQPPRRCHDFLACPYLIMFFA
jgi:hypothetical protein